MSACKWSDGRSTLGSRAQAFPRALSGHFGRYSRVCLTGVSRSAYDAAAA